MQEETRRVLIIDDTESDRLSVRHALEKRRQPGYLVHEVQRGSMLEAACRQFQPDCILLDFQLPDTNGIELLAEIRKKFGSLRFAVVMLTGSGDEILAVRALKAGAHDYLPKGYVTGELLDRAIQNALEKLDLERQRHATEEALAESERKLRHVINAAPCALYTVDLVEGRCLYVSAYAESLIGYTAEELDHMGAAGVLARIHVEDRAGLQQHLKRLRVAALETILECHFRIQHKDQSWRWLSTRDRVVAQDELKLASVVAGAASDITERRGMEEELRHSREQLLLAQDAAGMGTWSLDVDERKLDCSPLFLKLYGRGAEKAEAEDVWERWVHQDDRERVKAEVARALEGARFETEFRVLCPDGSIHWLRSQGKFIDGAGQAASFLGASLDVTEKRKKEEELRRSNDELERFAYVASHDLQEPLRTMLSFSELFARRNKNVDAESRQYLEFIKQGGQRMQTLIADLLTFSRVTQAGQEPLEPIDANEALEDVLSGMRALISDSGATVEVERLPALTANFQQLTQLLQNLIGNALKYRGEQPPSVKVSATRHPGAWQFSIADNGIGFDMIYAERIFDAFKRLHSRDQFAGTGIGLAICKRIVERHGGRIWAESTVGKGSTFYFTIADSADASVATSAP